MSLRILSAKAAVTASAAILAGLVLVYLAYGITVAPATYVFPLISIGCGLHWLRRNT